MYCTKCGNSVNDGANFCGKCGSPINHGYLNNTPDDLDDKDWGEEVTYTQADGSGPNEYYEPEYETKSFKLSSLILPFSIGILIGLALILGYCYLMEDFDTSKEPEKNNTVEYTQNYVNEPLNQNSTTNVNNHNQEDNSETKDNDKTDANKNTKIAEDWSSLPNFEDVTGIECYAEGVPEMISELIRAENLSSVDEQSLCKAYIYDISIIDNPDYNEAILDWYNTLDSELIHIGTTDAAESASVGVPVMSTYQTNDTKYSLVTSVIYQLQGNNVVVIVLVADNQNLGVIVGDTEKYGYNYDFSHAVQIILRYAIVVMTL